MKTIRWGMIGCGDVTEVKSGPGFQKARGSQLVAVMRRNAGLAQDYAERHGVLKWYADAQALIDDPDVDAVYIATPPDSHRAYTLAVARARKPVYVEKPMALNAVECREMVTACRNAGTPLFVAYYRRVLPRFLKVKELVTGGLIGEVRLVEVLLTQPLSIHASDQLPWRVRPEIAGGGLFVDLASHTLDFLDFVLGPIRRARGFARNQAGAYPAEDIVSAAFEFENGVQAAGTWCFSAFAASDRVSIVGADGKVTYSMFANEPVQLETRDGKEAFDIANPPHVQQPLIQQVVDELLGNGKCVSTGESASRTSWVMDQLLKESTSS